MRNFYVTLLMSLMLASGLLVAVAGDRARAQPEPREGPVSSAPAEPGFAKDEILVKPEDDAPGRRLGEVNRANNAEVEERLPEADITVVELPRDLPVQAAVNAYENAPGIEYAEPNFELFPSATEPNDPRYEDLYGLDNTGQTGGTKDSDIDAPEAWDVGTGSQRTVTAVIDTGTDINHPDLRGNLWVNRDETPDNGKDDDNNGYVDDRNGWDFFNDDKTVYDSRSVDDHGTHVSGTIAAQGDNGRGVTGVNWDGRIMPLKFIGPRTGYTSDAIKAIDYAVDNGANISNNSWGGGGRSRALKDAITRAGDQGHLLVAAAGNGGSDGVGDDNDQDPFYPASYDNNNIISVAATDSSDRLARFSNFGSNTVDLGAPGVGILSTVPGNGYGYKSGTSMASPHVAGAAALLESQNPGSGAAELKRRILRNADRVSDLNGKTVTGDRLNAAKARGECTITGTTGDDTIRGTAGRDIICGLEGDDEIYGLGGDDTIYGQIGNDTIKGGDGRNRLVGNAGNDRLVGGNAADKIYGQDGDDTVIGLAGDDVILGGNGANRLVGRKGDDRLTGGAGVDDMFGQDGADVLVGLAGDDNIRAGNGSNRIFGGGGEDLLIGGNDRDKIYGQSGNDKMFGLRGDDLMRGLAGEDSLIGRAGDDRLIGGRATDRLLGQGGNDTLSGSGGGDFLTGHTGRDNLFGESGRDYLDGRDKVRRNDYLNGGSQKDRGGADRGDRVVSIP